jgi:general secretion pathway protein L
MATKIVGLDLGTHTVKVCELVTTFRNFELVGFGSEPVDGPPDQRPSIEDIAAAARRLLERRGLLNETLMCALPPGLASTTVLTLPFDQPKKIEAVLPFQLDEVIPFDVEDVVYDYQIASRTESGGATVLVAYVKREPFGAFLETLQAAGIDPKVVGIGPLSFFNLYDHVVPQDLDAAVAVVDIGHDHSEITLFDAGHPVVVRDVTGGGREVTLALAEAFQVEAAQAERGKLAEGFLEARGGDTQVDATVDGPSRRTLISDACRRALAPTVRDLRRSIVAHEVTTGHTLRTLYLTGGGSQLRGLPEFLEHALKVEVRPLDPLTVPFNRLADGGDSLRPYVAKALALSLRAFHRQHQSQLNFRKGDHAYTGDFGFLRGRFISVGVALVMMVVLAAMVAVSRKRVLEAEYLTLQAQTRALSEQVLGYESEDEELLYQTVVGQDTKKTNPIPEVSAFQVMAELSERIPYDLEVDVDRLEVDLDRNNMQLHGRTKSGGDVERIVEAIRQTTCFKGRVNKERVEKSVDGRTKFRISAQSTCG